MGTRRHPACWIGLPSLSSDVDPFPSHSLLNGRRWWLLFPLPSIVLFSDLSINTDHINSYGIDSGDRGHQHSHASFGFAQ